MPAKRRLRFRTSHSPIGFALAAVIAAVGLTALAAPALGATGSVYVDPSFNAAAGNTLFNGTFTGIRNVGLGYSVMPNLTSGDGNVASGFKALFSNATGQDN